MKKNLLLIWQFVCVMVFSMAYELCVASYTIYLSKSEVALATMFSASIPYLLFLASHWFIETKSVWIRLWLTMGTSVGYGIGTFVAMKFF